MKGVIMFKKFIRMSLVTGLGLGLCGCAYLYRADDDKAAQAASKSFNDAAIGKALEAEREALVKSQQERQELVKRSEFARRDDALVRAIGGGTETWAVMKDTVEKRLVEFEEKLARAWRLVVPNEARRLRAKRAHGPFSRVTLCRYL